MMYGYTPEERMYLKQITNMIIENVLKPRLDIINLLMRNNPRYKDESSDDYYNMLADKHITEDLIELLKIYGEDGFVEFGF